MSCPTIQSIGVVNNAVLPSKRDLLMGRIVSRVAVKGGMRLKLLQHYCAWILHRNADDDAHSIILLQLCRIRLLGVKSSVGREQHNDLTNLIFGTTAKEEGSSSSKCTSSRFRSSKRLLTQKYTSQGGTTAFISQAWIQA